MDRGARFDASGDHAGAVTALREGIKRAEATDTIGYAVPARYRLGELLGGDEGQALIQEALEAMTAWGVKNPARWLAVYMPGRWDGGPLRAAALVAK
jgi:hypothetical protein